MDIIEKLANYRQRKVTDLSDTHVERLQKSLQELENQVISEASKINPTRGTLKLRTTAAIAIRPKLKNIIENTYLTAVQSNIAEYDKAASWLVATFKEYPIPDEFKQITELDLTTIQQLKRAAYLPFEDLGNEFSNELAQEVYNSTITGKPTDQMISDLRGKINGVYQSTDNQEAQELVDFINNNPDKTEAIQTAATRLQTIYGRDRLGNNLRRYATQMVQDSLMGFDGQFAKYRADELGLTHYVYSGTTVRDSRDFCRTHVGKIYNEEEIRQIWSSQTWQGKAQGDPFIKRGGYNCRHHWQPTDPEWGEENDDFPTTDDIKEQKENIILDENNTFSYDNNINIKDFNNAMNRLEGQEQVTSKLSQFVAAKNITTYFVPRSISRESVRNKYIGNMKQVYKKNSGKDLEPFLFKKSSKYTNGYTFKNEDFVVTFADPKEKVNFKNVDTKVMQQSVIDVLKNAKNNSGKYVLKRGTDKYNLDWSFAHALKDNPSNARMSTTLHELGHQVHFWATDSLGNTRRSGVPKFTVYGETNDREYFAELFSAYATNKKAVEEFSPELAKQIEEMLDLAIKSKVKDRSIF